MSSFAHKHFAYGALGFDQGLCQLDRAPMLAQRQHPLFNLRSGAWLQGSQHGGRRNAGYRRPGSVLAGEQFGLPRLGLPLVACPLWQFFADRGLKLFSGC